jgi:hypothetical protein
MTQEPANDPGISHEKTWRDFALAIDGKSLDPNHKVNRYLSETRKSGSLPQVIHLNVEDRWASVELPAVSATIKIPLGWHVLDDGSRALIFDADGIVQFNFTLVAAEGRDVDGLIAETRRQVAANKPNLQTLVEDLGEMKLLAVADLVIEGQTVDVCWLYSKSPIEPDLYLQVRVTAPADHMTRAMDLFELLMTEFRFLVIRAPDDPDAEFPPSRGE